MQKAPLFAHPHGPSTKAVSTNQLEILEQTRTIIRDFKLLPDLAGAYTNKIQ